MRKAACFVSPSRSMTMRVVLASELDATNVVGAPSRPVKMGCGSGSDLAGDDAFVGDGAVLGTRWNEEQAASESAARAKRNDATAESVYRTVQRIGMTLLTRWNSSARSSDHAAARQTE